VSAAREEEAAARFGKPRVEIFFSPQSGLNTLILDADGYPEPGSRIVPFKKRSFEKHAP